MMNNINLIPRKSVIEKHLIVLLALVIAAGLLILGYQIDMTTSSAQQEQAARLETTRIEQKIQSLLEVKTIDNRTLEYNKVKVELENLKLTRPDWITDITYILGYLPKGTKVRSMSVDLSAHLQAELHFQDQTELLVYLSNLQSEPSYRSLIVKELTKHTNPFVVDLESSSEPPSPAGDEAVVEGIESGEYYYRLLMDLKLKGTGEGGK